MLLDLELGNTNTEMFCDKKGLPVVRPVDTINRCYVRMLDTRKDPGLLLYIDAMKLSNVGNPKKCLFMLSQEALIKVLNIVVVMPWTSEKDIESSFDRTRPCSRIDPLSRFRWPVKYGLDFLRVM